MRYSLLLFDLDGTLVDSHHEICVALEMALLDMGLSLGMPRVQQLVDGSPLECIWDNVLAVDLAGRRPDMLAEFPRFVTAYRTHYMRDLGHATAAFPDVHRTLTRIRSFTPPVLCAVVSNKSDMTVAPLLERLHLATFFDLALGCGGTSIPAKPEPDLLLEAARLLKQEPNQCAMIGDTTLDVIAGKRAGMTTYALSHGMAEHQALVSAGADYVLRDFNELEQALFSG